MIVVSAAAVVPSTVFMSAVWGSVCAGGCYSLRAVMNMLGSVLVALPSVAPGIFCVLLRGFAVVGRFLSVGDRYMLAGSIALICFLACRLQRLLPTMTQAGLGLNDCLMST